MWKGWRLLLHKERSRRIWFRVQLKRTLGFQMEAQVSKHRFANSSSMKDRSPSSKPSDVSSRNVTAPIRQSKSLYPGAYKAGDSIKEAYKQAGFDSFADYMNERQPCGIKRTQAYALIQAMKIRPLLPEIPGPPENAVWTETSIRPLLHKDFTPADQWCPGASIFTGQPLKIR